MTRRRFLALLAAAVAVLVGAAMALVDSFREFVFGVARKIHYHMPGQENPDQIKAYERAVAALPADAQRASTPLVWARDGAAFKRNGNLDHRRIGDIVDRAVCRFTSTSDVAAAYRTLVTPEDRVALRLPAVIHDDVVDAVVRGLLAAGVPPQQIVLFKSGYRDVAVEEPYYMKPPVKGLRVQEGIYADAPVKVGTIDQRVVKALDECTAFINTCCLHTHIEADMTGALKNHMGSIDQPFLLHSSLPHNLALLNSLPQLAGEKLKLVVMDALEPSLKGHPDHPVQRHFYRSGSIIVSRDPVAADTIGLGLLRAGLKEHDLDDGLDEMPGRLALAGNLGLGQHRQEHIQVTELSV